MGNLNPRRIILIGLFNISIISPLSYAYADTTATYQSFDQSVTVYIDNSTYISSVVFDNSEDSCSVNLRVSRLQGHLFSKSSVNFSTFQWQLAQFDGAADISGVLVYTPALGSSYIQWDNDISKGGCKIKTQRTPKRIFPL